MFRNLSVGSRLTFIITFVVVIILIAVTFIETRSSNTALYRNVQSQFLSKSEAVRKDIDAEFARLTELAKSFSNRIGLMGNPNESTELRNTIDAFVRDSNDDLVVRFGVYRPDKKVGVLELENPLLPASSGNSTWRVYSQPSEIPSDTRLYETLQGDQNEPVWFQQIETFYDDQRQPSITLVMPYKINNVVAGFVWVDVPQEEFETRVTGFLNQRGLLFDTVVGYTLLVDDQGSIITKHNFNRSSLRTLQNNLITSNAATSDNAILLEDLTTLLNRTDSKSDELLEFNDPIVDETVIASLSTFKNNQWRFISTYPISEIPEVPASVFGPILIISTFGVLVLVWLINGFTQSAVSDPLKRLGTSAQEIGSGDFRYYIAYRDRHDEVGRLAQALEDMRVSLEHSYDELSRWGRTLERRVVDRTKELDQARQSALSSANELKAIYNESLLVVNETQLKPILDALTKRLPALLNSTYVAVWLGTEERDRLQLVATNESRQREGIIIKANEGIAGQSFQQARPIILDNYKEYEHSIPLVGFGKDAPFDRAMSVPLIYVGRPIGAIVVGRPMESVSYNDDDQRLLALFANLVSPTVRNAQLFVRMNEAVDEAERANQVKTRFLASVTHELRTPLNLIINNMDFMRIGAFGDVNKEQASRLGQTVRSAEHLLYLINDLLDVSKIEAGEMQLFIQDNAVEVMVDDSIDNTVAFMDKIDGKTDAVEFVVDIEEDLPKIPMDVRRVRQVLTNLLTNAVKFTDQGTVSLKVRKIDEGIEFSVTDTGMGIPAEETEKLFQAFERTSNAKVQNIEGTGLGLPISKFLVEQHGGQLTFVSEVNKGTTFTFTLPFKQQTASDTGIFHRSDPAIAAILSSKND